ncbi:MAG: hypothetical protein RL094_802 [Candidatus Parcubacteria bacterium]|jgi:Gpi18-like mannosyltransferase
MLAKDYLKEYAAPVGIFILSRLCIFLIIALVSMYGMGRGANISQWDAKNYISIAEQGYQFDGTYRGQSAYIAYFPLLPALMSGVSASTGVQASTAGIMVSALFGILSVILLYRLIANTKGRQAGLIAVSMFSFYPASVFLSSSYTESLFAFLVLTTFLCIQKKQFRWAIVPVALACITRPTGAILGIVYLYSLYKDKYPLYKIAFYGFLAGIPFYCFLFFQYLQYGTAFAFMKAQSVFWNQHLVPVWEGMFLFYKDVFTSTWAVPMRYQDGLICTLVIFLLVYAWKHTPRHIWYFGLGVVLLTLSSDKILGMGRYMMLVFPIYYALAHLGEKYKHLYPYMLVVSAMWCALITVIFSIKELVF